MCFVCDRSLAEGRGGATFYDIYIYIYNFREYLLFSAIYYPPPPPATGKYLYFLTILAHNCVLTFVFLMTLISNKYNENISLHI